MELNLPEPVFGFLNIDKPLNLTSHDVVARVRRLVGIKRVGHAGTLDPLATGVLAVCLGAATRLSEYVMHTTKHYKARIRLGIVTETYDAEGKIQSERGSSAITRPEVEQALKNFLGDIQQVPPMYSAIKQGGRKLYELARVGETLEREARSVRIDALAITDWQPPEFTLEATCSAGTYIRSLAHDLGETLGVGAHLAGLVRTASGEFTLDNAVSLSTLESDGWKPYVISIDSALAHLPTIHLGDEEAERLLHGQSVPAHDTADGILGRAYRPDGHFIAIVKASGGWWKPEKVFPHED